MFRSIQVADDGGKNLIPVLSGFATLFAFFYLGSAFVAGDASDLLGRWQVFWRLCIATAAAAVVLRAGASSFLWDNVYSLLFAIGDAAASAFGSAAIASGCPAASTAGVVSGAQDAVKSMSEVVCGGFIMTKDGIATGWAVANTVDGIINSLIYAVAGILLMAIYALLAITFPLRFIDVLLKLAIVSLITPFLVIAAVFKATRGYASIAISNVLNASALFAVVSIIFRIGSIVMKEFVDNSSIKTAGESQSIIFGNTSPADAIFSSVILVCVAMTFLGMLKSAPAIAAEFSRSTGGSSEAGNAAAGAMTAPIKMAAGGAAMASGVGTAMAARNVAAATRMREGAMFAEQVGGSVAKALGKNAVP